MAEVMERLDVTELEADPSTVNQVKLAILWHEVASNLGFLGSAAHKGYGEKIYRLLTSLEVDHACPPGYLPYVAAYRASALALWAGEVGDLGRLGQALALFDQAVARYIEVSYAPEFLRGSVAENLPWYFFKGSVAQRDFESLIAKAKSTPDSITPRVLSFTYWAWANNKAKSSWFLFGDDQNGSSRPSTPRLLWTLGTKGAGPRRKSSRRHWPGKSGSSLDSLLP